LRRFVTLILSFAITALFLALTSVDFGKPARAIASVDYRLVALAALFTFRGNVLRAKRWQHSLAPKKQIPVTRLFLVRVIGLSAV